MKNATDALLLHSHSHGVLAAADAQQAVVVKADATQCSIALAAFAGDAAWAVLCGEQV